MEKNDIECRQFSQKFNKGFTLIEMLVASLIGVIVVMFALTAMIDMRTLYNNDSRRSELTQNMRIAGTLLNSYILQAGEYLPQTFPAIELINGASGTTDQLIIRRGLVSAIPRLCANIVPLSVIITNTTPTSGCAHSANLSAYNIFSAYRTANGNTVRAFIYDISTRLGEFFNYTGETNSGTQLSFTRTGTFANAYTTAGTSIYLIQQMRIFRNGDQLQLEFNGDSATIQTITFGINDFSVRIIDEAGTIYTSFARSNDWKNIREIEITLSGSITTSEGVVNESFVTELYPRNILAS